MRNVLILGAGISGLGAAHVLLKHGVSVLISDLKDTIQDKKEKEALPLSLLFHTHYKINNIKYKCCNQN